MAGRVQVLSEPAAMVFSRGLRQAAVAAVSERSQCAPMMPTGPAELSGVALLELDDRLVEVVDGLLDGELEGGKPLRNVERRGGEADVMIGGH